MYILIALLHCLVLAFLQVPYNLTGWLEKNKDPLNDSVVDQFKKGSNALLCEIFADHPGQSGGKDDGGGGKGIKYCLITCTSPFNMLTIRALEFTQSVISKASTIYYTHKSKK